jgi:hypothetical protein
LADLLLLRRRVPASSPLQNACQFAYFPCLLGATRKERQARRVKNRRKIYEIYNPYFYISKIFLNKLLLIFLNYFDMIILKIIFLKFKKYYFNLFSNKKYFKK